MTHQLRKRHSVTDLSQLEKCLKVTDLSQLERYLIKILFRKCWSSSYWHAGLNMYTISHWNLFRETLEDDCLLWWLWVVVPEKLRGYNQNGMSTAGEWFRWNPCPEVSSGCPQRSMTATAPVHTWKWAESPLEDNTPWFCWGQWADFW